MSASFIRVAGEGFDADLLEWECEDCGHDEWSCECGEALVCPYCDRAPDARGYCASCDEYAEPLVEVEHLGPGRIAA